MVQKKGKRAREEVRVEEEEEVVETTRGSEEEPAPKRARWTNKTRVLVISARGIGFRSGRACQSVPGVVHYGNCTQFYFLQDFTDCLRPPVHF